MCFPNIIMLVFKFAIFYLLPVFMVYISFSCLSWTFSIMLNSNGKSGYPFTFLILEGKSMMLLLSTLVVCLPGMALLC